MFENDQDAPPPSLRRSLHTAFFVETGIQHLKLMPRMFAVMDADELRRIGRVADELARAAEAAAAARQARAETNKRAAAA